MNRIPYRLVAVGVLIVCLEHKAFIENNNKTFTSEENVRNTIFIHTHTHTQDIDNQHTDANSLYRHNIQTETYHEDERPQTFCQRLAEQQVTDLEASGQLVQIDLLSSHVGF